MNTSARVVVFAFLCFLSTAILWRPFWFTLQQAIRDPESAYLLLVLPTSTALIISGWRSRDLSEHVNPWLGGTLVILGAAVAIFTWRSSGGNLEGVWPSLGMIALVILWIGEFVLTFGNATARRFLFALGFLFWTVPIPSVLLASIVQFMQWTSAVSAAFLFSILGTPVSRTGIVLKIPNLAIEVAQECSSLRSSLILILVTMVLAHLLLKSFWKQAFLVFLAIPLAVAKNALRIVTIGLLGTRVDPAYLTGRLHREGGVVFFSLALAVIAVLLWLMRRGEQHASSAVRQLSPVG